MPMSDEEKASYDELTKTVADQATEIDELRGRVETLENASSATSKSSIGDLSASDVIWIKNVLHKYHGGEMPPVPPDEPVK